MKLILLFLTFLRIGAFTFGGGYAMLAMVIQESTANRWLTQAEVIRFLAISESTPGSFAVNIATFVGGNVGGFPGACAATLGVVLPSFILVAGIGKAYSLYCKNPKVSSFLRGIVPCVMVLVTSSALSLFPTVFSLPKIGSFANLIAAGIVVSGLFLLKRRKSPLLFILSAAALSAVAGYCGLLQ